MKRTGRVSLLVIFAIVGVGIIVALSLFSSESPTNVATRFLTALKSRDVNQLVELSSVPKEAQPSLKQQWDYTVNVATPTYYFIWRVIGQSVSGDEATVKVGITPNADIEGSYETNYDLKLVRVNGKWKVDLFELPRKFYPALPKANVTLGSESSSKSTP